MRFKNIIRNFLQIVFWIYLSVTVLHAQNTDIERIEVFGQPVFGQAAIITTEAGEDISGTIMESQSNTRLNIFTNRKGNFEYEVWVRAVNIPDGVILEVRRDNAGVKPNGGGGPNALTGGTNFFAINDTPQSFFTGKEERVDIELRFQLRNISVVQPIENQSYQIFFEVNFR